MKTAFLLFASILFTLSTALYAQPCYNQIRTNPDDPQNIPCPSMENVFDWRIENIPSNSSVTPTGGTFKSPYYETVNPSLYFLTLEGMPTYRDYEPEDGWELIGEYFNPETPDDFVCFVMYNRFESFLRVFTTLPNLGTPMNYVTATVKLILGEEDGYSALLSPSTGINQALDQKSIPQTSVTNKYVNSNFKFNYFDIPVEYDPCTCTLNSTSLSIEFERTISQELDLYGRYQEVTTQLANVINLDSFIFPSNSLTSFGDMDGNYSDGAGNHVYNIWNNLVNQHEAWKDEHDILKMKYERIEAFNKALDLILKSGAVGSAILKPLLALKVVEVGSIVLTGKDILNDFLKVPQLWGAGVKKELDASNKRLDRLGTSTLTHGEIVLKGSITSNFQEARAIVRSLPGSSTSNCSNPILYPVYNEVLGRIAVLKTPEISQIGKVNISTTTINEETQSHFATLALQFDPNSFDYVFNPAAGIIEEGTEMWASLEFEVPIDTLDFWDAPTNSKNLLESYRDAQVVLLSTPLMPFSCLGEYVSEINLTGQSTIEEYEHPDLTSVKVNLKLFVDYQFEAENRALQLYNYPVEIDFNPGFGFSFMPYQEVTEGTTPGYLDVLSLETTHYTEDELIFAWSSIEIDGNLTAASGVTVEIIAPNITLIDGATVGSDIWLRSGFSPFSSCDPIEEYNSANLAAFCNSGTYQASLASYTIPEEESAILAARAEEEARQEQASRQAIALRAFPNPLEDFGTLEFVLPADMPVSAYLSDMHGQRLQELVSPRDLPAGRHLFDLTLVNLPPGMYLLTLQTPEGPQTVKLVRL